MEKENRRLVAEYVSREMMEAVDIGILLDIEANLMRSLQHTFPQAPDEEHARTVTKILQRAWCRVGEDVLGRMAEAEIVASGRDTDRKIQPFTGSGILGT
jgi:hypothetical protein